MLKVQQSFLHHSFHSIWGIYRLFPLFRQSVKQTLEKNSICFIKFVNWKFLFKYLQVTFLGKKCFNKIFFLFIDWKKLLTLPLGFIAVSPESSRSFKNIGIKLNHVLYQDSVYLYSNFYCNRLSNFYVRKWQTDIPTFAFINLYQIHSIGTSITVLSTLFFISFLSL